MPKNDKPNLLEESQVVTQKDLEVKLKKLETYVTKAQLRIKTHERSISRLQQAIKKDLGKVNASVKKIKSIKVNV
jgi:hypothetical protein